MTEYRIPDRVLANAEKRLAAASQFMRRKCATCPKPSTHWPCCGHPSCEDCRITPPPVVPDPARTLDGLQAAARRAREQATA